MNIKCCVEQDAFLTQKAERQFNKLLQSAAKENGLTKEQADALIERVILSPGGNVEVEWKSPDCRAKTA